MELLAKTVKITNRRNVLVQIPGFVIAAWSSADELEVYYDEELQIVTIRPAIRRGICFTKEGSGVAGTTEA